jgi:phosphinothricin acetyltransferase
MLRPVREEDAPVICDIYNYYVEHSAVTFEEEPLSPRKMAERIRGIAGAYPYLVWEGEEGLTGYAYASRWKERVSYRFSVELSLYLRKGFEGRGMGTALMARLLEELRAQGLHLAVSGITLPNKRSVALHEKFGFEKAAHFREAGFKLGRWQDVGYWQLCLGSPDFLPNTP